MNQMKKIIVSALAFTVFGTGVLGVKADSVGGGTWNYGVGFTGSYSDYYHATREHSSTVRKGAKGDKDFDGPGNWSKARLTEYSGCQFFWAYED